jgi:metallo-beta-lactamase family protein
MKLSFHGADRNVTGSCHLVECGGRRVLIDCGMFQGSRALEEDNAEPFAFDAATVDTVLLTHAHLDHCGRLPLLAKRGFHGEIITTAASRELARLVMLDAANLQEEEARRRARHGTTGPAAAPLYTVLDALNGTEGFGRTAEFDHPLDLAPGVRATFLDAGHILGSACVLLEVKESGGRRCRLLFSGDLGNSARQLLRDPAVPPPVDAVVMETTYGDRLHKPLQPSVEELYGAISDTLRRGGNVIIPTFALERAQEILFYLREGIEQAAKYFADGGDPFSLPGLHFTRETAESIALNQKKGGAIIMAGSGMCTGGRVRHHLRHNLARQEASVVFVGYAAQGTLARRIIDGAKEVHLFGEQIPVRARTYTINAFSAHADQAELLAWHSHTEARRTFLVHGEPETMRHFAGHLSGTHVEMPMRHQAFEL